jgi:SP family myo-inositol transporter-like MFS transporter 13
MSTGHTDTAAQPLISNEDERSERSHSYDEDAGVDESQLVSPGLFVSILTICAGISGLLFGYEYVHTSNSAKPTAPTILPPVFPTVTPIYVTRC